MKKILGIIFLAAAVVLGGIFVLATGQKNDIVIDRGIQFYRNARTGLGISGIVSLILGLFFLALSAGQKSRNKKAAGRKNSRGSRAAGNNGAISGNNGSDPQTADPSGESGKERISKLSASKKLRNHELRELLGDYARGDFLSISSSIEGLISVCC